MYNETFNKRNYLYNEIYIANGFTIEKHWISGKKGIICDPELL